MVFQHQCWLHVWYLPQVCYKVNQFSADAALMLLLVVLVKIAKAEPQFSDLIYELQHPHGPGHARTASTSCPAQWRQFLEEDPPDSSALLRTDLNLVRQLWQLGPPVSCHSSCSVTEGHGYPRLAKLPPSWADGIWCQDGGNLAYLSSPRITRTLCPWAAEVTANWRTKLSHLPY